MYRQSRRFGTGLAPRASADTSPAFIPTLREAVRDYPDSGRSATPSAPFLSGRSREEHFCGDAVWSAGCSSLALVTTGHNTLSHGAAPRARPACDECFHRTPAGAITISTVGLEPGWTDSGTSTLALRLKREPLPRLRLTASVVERGNPVRFPRSCELGSVRA